mgnify:CR=1 FL=1
MKLKHYYILLGTFIIFSFIKANVIPLPVSNTDSNLKNEPLYVYFFNVGQGSFTLLKHGDKALIIDAGSLDRKFSEIKEIFETHLGNAKIKAILLTHNSHEHHNFVKTLRKHYCDDDCAILSIYKQKIRLSHEKKHCEYLSFLVSSDLQQLSSFLSYKFPKLSFKFPIQLAPFSATKVTDPSLITSIEYQGIKLLFTGAATAKQLNYFVDTKRHYNDAEKINLIQNNTQIFNHVNIFILPTDTAQILPWSTFIANHNSQKLTTIFLGNIQTLPNLNLLAPSIKNNLFFTCDSKNFPYFKIENHSIFKYDFYKKCFINLF